MNTVNELDNLLKHAMQFDSGEVAEPNPSIQRRLHRKVKGHGRNKLSLGLSRLLGLDIKLYYLALAVSAVAIIFIVLRNTENEPKHNLNNVIIADSNSGSDTNFGTNPRYDTFLAKKSTIQIY